MIRLEDVTFTYKGSGQKVLRNLNLSISRGESVCVMGANGSGKSTLARLIAGLDEPSSGTIQVNGSPDAARSSVVGILFQNPDNQMVAAVVEKEIAFALENRAMPMEQMGPIVDSTLERFRITHLRRRLTTELSGGEKQRVALASVMVSRPPILVLDEPDSFLDEAGKQILSEELRQLHAHRPELTEVRITQYPDQARQYRRMIVLADGAVVADGNPNSILDDRAFCVRHGLRFDESLCDSVRVPDKNHGDASLAHTVALEEATIEYPDGPVVLEHVNVTWNRGEIVGLVGASGSGKSTLAMALCDLLPLEDGKRRLLDQGANEVNQISSAGVVAGLFQQPERQFFLPTCAEEIAFGPSSRGFPPSPELIAAYMQMVGLDPERFGQRDPFTLSMGEKRRLAFAAVLSMQPPFVIFDEPTCGLDPEGVGRFLLLARALKDRKVGQIIISHDGALIRLLADRILHCREGSVSEVAPGDFFGDSRYKGVVSEA